MNREIAPDKYRIVVSGKQLTLIKQAVREQWLYWSRIESSLSADKAIELCLDVVDEHEKLLNMLENLPF